MNNVKPNLLAYSCFELDSDNLLRNCLEDHGFRIVYAPNGQRPTEKKLAELSDTFHLLLIGHKERINKCTINRPGPLKYILSMTSGIDHIDEEFCQREKIEFVTANGANSTSVAEHALMLLLMVLKSAYSSVNSAKHGYFRDRIASEPRDLLGLRVGIVGFGRVGRALHSLLQPFGCTLHAWTQNPKKYCDFKEVTFTPSLQNLFQMCDAIVVCLPLTSETRGIIGEECLLEPSNSRIIVNISRHEVIDGSAFLKAIHTGHVTNSALDVYPEENYTEYVNAGVLLTPHLAGITLEAIKRMERTISERFSELFRKMC